MKTDKAMPSIVILAGGFATRLYPVTKRISKSMIRVSGKPFIGHQLELLREKGISKVTICIGYLGNTIKDYVKDGKSFGLDISYSDDGTKPLGTGGAIKKALPLLDNVFFIIYGDSYLDIDFIAVFDFFNSHAAKGLMTVLKNENQWDKSNIIYNHNRIISYDKNKITDEAMYIDFGLGILKKQAFSSFPDDESFDLSKVYKILIENDELLGYEVFKRFYEIGSLKGLKDTRNYIKGLITTKSTS